MLWLNARELPGDTVQQPPNPSDGLYEDQTKARSRPAVLLMQIKHITDQSDHGPVYVSFNE
ncbi:hypothetical protein SBBP2_290006 [Burkholderiales bacterium]|nr:hypothetical protein SBBP2_290006 [Burkholderiales bacterium]